MTATADTRRARGGRTARAPARSEPRDRARAAHQRRAGPGRHLHGRADARAHRRHAGGLDLGPAELARRRDRDRVLRGSPGSGSRWAFTATSPTARSRPSRAFKIPLGVAGSLAVEGPCSTGSPTTAGTTSTATRRATRTRRGGSARTGRPSPRAWYWRTWAGCSTRAHLAPEVLPGLAGRRRHRADLQVIRLAGRRHAAGPGADRRPVDVVLAGRRHRVLLGQPGAGLLPAPRHLVDQLDLPHLRQARVRGQGQVQERGLAGDPVLRRVLAQPAPLPTRPARATGCSRARSTSPPRLIWARREARLGLGRPVAGRDPADRQADRRIQRELGSMTKRASSGSIS